MTARVFHFITALPRRLKQRGAGLVVDAGLMTAAVMTNRLTRLATAIALAWTLDVAEFGIAMIAMTVHEIVRMFFNNGLGARIVAANDLEADDVANAVFQLNWILCATLFLLQTALAWPIAAYFGSSELGWALIALAAVNVIYPLAMVNVYVAQRQERWQYFSAATVAHGVIDNVLTIVLAFVGFGIWAIVLPKLVVAVGWVILHRQMTRWHPNRKLSLAQTFAAKNRSLIAYSSRVLAVELLATLRTQGDKVLIAAVLGPVALGYYAFAANIGRGFTISISGALSTVVLPFMRRSRDSGQLRSSFAHSLTLMTASIAPPAIGLAATAAWIVPLVFGEKWEPAAPLVAILAIGSIAHPFVESTSQMLRADNRTRDDLRIAIVLTGLSFAAILLALSYGLIAVAVTIAAVQLTAAMAVAAYAFHTLAPERKQPTAEGAAA